MKVELHPVVGDVIRSSRISADLSQAELADIAHVDRSYLSRIENGRVSPTIEFIFKIAPHLKVSPSALLAKAETRLKNGNKAYGWLRASNL